MPDTHDTTDTTGRRLAALLERHGRTYAQEAGIRLADEPAPLFCLLVLTQLLSANLSADLGVRAADLLRRRLGTAAAMAGAGQDERHELLVEARYLRKEQTAQRLGDLATQVVERYDGDLRRLRDEADGDLGRATDLLTDLTGLGPLGAAIFLREVQAVWPSVRPFLDDRVVDAARALGVPHTARGLADRLDTDDLSTVGAALVRARLAGELD